MRRLPATLATLLLLAPAAHGADRVSATHTFTTQKPGKTTGRLYTLRVVDPGAPAGKPPALARVELTLPRGSRFDTTAIPQCTANDAQLMLAGAGACPEQSRLGTNVVVVDTGTGTVTTDFEFLNAPGQVLLVGAPRGTATRVVLRATVRGRRFAVNVPMLPGTPPDGGATRSEHAQFLRSRGYLRTPRRCPRSRQWITRVDYTFRDGETERVRATSPCVRRRGAPGSRRRGSRPATTSEGG